MTRSPYNVEEIIKKEGFMNSLHPKVVIIGAGRVGSTYAFALMTTGLAREIVLIDKMKLRAKGEFMD